MENKELIFKDSHLDWIAQKLDDVTFKKPPIDVVDKPVYRLALGMINKAASPKVPDEYKAEFWEAMDLVVSEDYDDAGAEAFDIIIQLVENWEKLGTGLKDLLIGALLIGKGALAGLD